MLIKEDLKAKVLKGSMWSLVENFIFQIVQFFVSIILVRLLDPKDYGLIAVTGIFTSISAAITDGGFEKTVIQNKSITKIQISTIFYLNIFLGGLMTSVLFFLAPYIAIYFNEFKLIPVIRIVSFSILLTSLGQMQMTLLMKELQFKRITYAKLFSSWVSAFIGITMAIKGYGVWSLVYSTIAYQVITLLFFWIKSSWYPIFKFSFKSVKSILPYGFNILISSIFFFIIQQFNNFIVGKYYSKSILGFFTRGNKFPDLITSIIQSVVLNMALPLFSKLQDEPELLMKSVRKINKIVAFISFPFLLILFIKAHDLTIFLFTEKWSGSIIFLQFFCIVKIFDPFVAIQRELLLSKGKSKSLVRILVFTSLFEVVFTLFIFKYGILYIALSTFISKILQLIIFSQINSKMFGSTWLNDFNWTKNYFFTTIIMGVTIVLIDIFLSYSNVNMILIVKLIIELSMGLCTYLFIAVKFNLDEVKLIFYLRDLVLKKTIPKTQA